MDPPPVPGDGGWSDLLLDLFSLIFSKLSLPQLLRSAAVCVSWGYIVRTPATERESSEVIGFIPNRTAMSLLEYHHLKAIVSADSSLGDDFVVAVIHYPLSGISFTRPGYEIWFALTNAIAAQEILFHEGKTVRGHAVRSKCKSVTSTRPRFDMAKCPPRHHSHLHYLVRTPRGDLLNVGRQRKGGTTDTVSVEVYRWGGGGGGAE